jgi:fumarate hydratase subunit beta
VNLELPLSTESVRSLHCGDTVTLSGIIHTGRDEMHIRALEYLDDGEPLPVDIRGGAVFHCGPIMVEDQEEWKLVAAGPTTSARMNSLEPRFIEAFKPAVIIGKGGMSLPTVEAMRKNGCVYLALTGGAAVLAAGGIKRVIGVEWLDLGMPEALWILEAERFGPLTVAIDAHGNSIYEDVGSTVKQNLPRIMRSLGIE